MDRILQFHCRDLDLIPGQKTNLATGSSTSQCTLRAASKKTQTDMVRLFSGRVFGINPIPNKDQRANVAVLNNKYSSFWTRLYMSRSSEHTVKNMNRFYYTLINSKLFPLALTGSGSTE